MILTIIAFIIILGILIFIHELGHFLAAKSVGIKVEEFAFGFSPNLLSWKKGETTYKINAIPFGGYVKLYGEEGKGEHEPRSFVSKSILARFWVISAGVLMNFILAVILVASGFIIGMSPFVSSPSDFNQKNVQSQLLLLQIEPGSPAEKLGLKPGNAVIEADGQKFTTYEEFQSFTKSNRGKQVEIVWKADGKTQSGKVTLSTDETKGALGVVAIEESKVKLPFYKAIPAAFVETAKTIIYIVKAIVLIFKDLIVSQKAPQGVTGPIGIYKITDEVVKIGFIYVLQFVAMLSINLGIINFLPFPALDGGRVLFLIIEKIRGKKVTPKIENAIHTVGFGILIVLIVLITYQDIIKFFFTKE